MSETSAGVVIVGGGVVGLSIAYHLGLRGVRDVVVLEKEDLVGTGSTGRCAGGFRHQFSTEVNVALSVLSVAKLERFADEMDQPIDFHQDGYLFLLRNTADVDAFTRNAEMQRRLGVPVELLRPEDVARVLPGVALRLDDVLAASYCGRDGVSDPAGVTEGYRKNAVRLGAKILTGCEALGIDVVAGRVAGVRTAKGHIATPIVVNAAGPYAGRVGSMAGVEVPVVPLRRCIWTTRPFPGAPSRYTLVIDFATGFYFHRESGGVLFGMGNRAEAPTFDVSVDWTFFDTVLATGVLRYPALAEAAIHKSWAGSYETSPDAHPILGRVPSPAGFLLANGFSGHGFQHAPAVGQLIAEEIVDGQAHTIDISSLSIERFASQQMQREHNVV